jgi:hypothetical protein
MTPSDFHISLPSIVPFVNSETSFTHGCTYPIFPGSSGTTSCFRSFRFPVDHNFWQSHWVHFLNMSIPNELFRVTLFNIVSCASIFLLIYSFVFLSSLEILADRLNASNSDALILLLSSSYKLQY